MKTEKAEQKSKYKHLTYIPSFQACLQLTNLVYICIHVIEEKQ